METKKDVRDFDLTTREGTLAYAAHVLANAKPTARTGEAAKQGAPTSMQKLCQDRGVSANGWA